MTKQIGEFMGITTHNYDGPKVYAGDDVNPCGWMTEGRIWIPLSLCTLEKEIDYRWYRINYNNIARYNSITGELKNPEQTMIKTGDDEEIGEDSNAELLEENRQIDMSVVTLGGLSHFTYNGNWAYYQAMSIASNGSLSNMVINVTATIDMKDPKFSLESEALFVSIFQSVQGKINNVSIVGNIDIIDLNLRTTKQIFVSKALGDVWDTGDLDIQGLRSNLHYTFNGKKWDDFLADYLTTNSDVNATEISFTEDTAFGCYSGDNHAEQIETDDCSEIFTVDEIPEEEIEENKFIQTPLVVYDKVYEHTYSFSVSTGFPPNVHINAYRDYYTGALNRYLENMFEI